MKELKKNPFFLFFKFIFICLCICVLVFGGFIVGNYLSGRNHGAVKVLQYNKFAESADYLPNPNRGFYYMYGFMISDDENLDYNDFVPQKLSTGHDMQLAMVTINLQKYNDCSISEKGLRDIDAIFQALRETKKQFLIRFLYDWNGDNLEYEPQDISIILGHMKQLEFIFQEYSDLIFVHQGLFIGNWGEMNGTIHLEYINELATTLHQVMGEDTFFAVRMPAQWRKATGLSNPDKSSWPADSMAYNLSLYNDGMMGSFSDYGTYGLDSKENVGAYSPWNRTEEMIFQKELCKYVPNGGEVIKNNSYNDFNNALDNLRTMHITYLNYDYDQNVLKKWAKSTINDGSVFDGMDGLTYIERHLGYRFLIENALIKYRTWQDELEIDIVLKNVGFAPIYKDVKTTIVIQNKNTEECLIYPVAVDYSTLTGGYDSGNELIISSNISMEGYKPGEYAIYFGMEDVDSGQMIYLAIEQDITDYGYHLGDIVVEPIKNPLNQKELQLKNYMKEFVIEVFSEK